MTWRRIPPDNKGYTSRYLVDACMPCERKHQFPQSRNRAKN